ncbi:MULTISPECIES: PTS sugar transporter subunit IIA [Streptomyces]|uniref:PTS sugar transporter subunit IIA n=1 Tax=Streptomyces TaxID=1883 RepID=UPI0004CD2465|nr:MULTISPECIES: PTS sugar transporter subunit IIA [Streptomyces]KOT60072.1 hypothetical protein ADK43_15685 [Streptomyces rimosus subsp. rimosus]
MTSHPQTRPETITCLADYLPRQRIHPYARTETTDELLRTLTHGLHAEGTISDPDTFTQTLHTRLAHGPTGFHGIALLAARSRTITTPAAAFARIPRNLTWPSADDHTIHDVFLLAVLHRLIDTGCIQTYAVLARHTAHPGFRRMLSASRTTDELYELFRLIR